MNDELDIRALSNETDVNVRTIRYYVAEKLLPPPTGRGSAATYGPAHRDRLRLIRRLQEAHQPLAEIKKRLEALDDAGVAAALAETETRTTGAPANAYEYVRQVLGKGPPPAEAPPAAPTQTATPPATARTEVRSTWERIAVHPDVEIHVRRPLARVDQRRLDALLEEARRIFGEHQD